MGADLIIRNGLFFLDLSECMKVCWDSETQVGLERHKNIYGTSTSGAVPMLFRFLPSCSMMLYSRGAVTVNGLLVQ